jgi:hypothetical protein
MAMLGLDVVRGYELSWLDNKGKPQIACIEICVLPTVGKKLDTMSLKEICNSFAAQKLPDAAAVHAKIDEQLTNVFGTKPDRFNLLQAHDFCSTDLSLTSTAAVYFLSHNVRFICERTKQPCTGSLLVDAVDGKHSSKELQTTLQNKLQTLRNTSSNPQDYAEQLLLEGTVLSLHLARKGGLSWQIIRTLDPDVDLWAYVQRSAVE